MVIRILITVFKIIVEVARIMVAVTVTKTMAAMFKIIKLLVTTKMVGIRTVTEIGPSRVVILTAKFRVFFYRQLVLSFQIQR